MFDFHSPIVVLCWYYVAISAIGAMPTPDEAGNQLYRWAFGFLHLLAGNASRIPMVRALIGLQENPTTKAGISAQETAQVIDSKKPDKADP